VPGDATVPMRDSTDSAPRRGATTETARLRQNDTGAASWKYWGPYLSERQWGTVREDYSPSGKPWEYLPHEHARSRAYRWGEDGLAGFSDVNQYLCLAVTLWNEHDEILKERLFGLTNSEGNHGEDVKELYYYLDATPSHSYLRMLYKYPQAAFPYRMLVEENQRRGIEAPEFELLDTGVFDSNRYFDVFVEYAQAAPGDILLRVVAHNRGPDTAPLRLLPTCWFRNTWSWQVDGERPRLTRGSNSRIDLHHGTLGDYHLYCDGEPTLLFCENESNAPRLWDAPPTVPHPKDGINNFIVNGNEGAVNPASHGTKVAASYRNEVSACGSIEIRLRLSPENLDHPFGDFDSIFAARRREADDFYADLQRDVFSADARLVQRQAFAGLIWSKQYYYLDVPQWLRGDATQPAPPPARRRGRNSEWAHVNNADILSVPDKWEYPWYASWDLAFHCLPLALLDPVFAKEQLVLLTREWYMHPNGQIPAYEWALGDVNPPVHAWAAWRVYQIDRKHNGGQGDLMFLERVFHKLMLNFTWWVNRKDVGGRNVFQGGFLGLDNIGVFDRSVQLPTGGHIDQSDGTSWMAMYCLNLMRIALELAQNNHVYEDIATKFFEHFLHIAEAMCGLGGDRVELWDDEDKFFYDVLHLPDGAQVKMKVRSMVGLIPLFAVETLEPELLDRLPQFKRRLQWFLRYRPDLAALVSHWNIEGRGRRRLLSLLRGHRLQEVLQRVLDETEFLSDYGVRALSRVHAAHPYQLEVSGMQFTVRYQPAESDTVLFGGNSNWRGPIWFPVNYLLIESLQKFHHYYGDAYQIECPTGSGQFLSIGQVAEELTRRLTRLFLRGPDARRPMFGSSDRLQLDPHFRDHLLFYECFHGDSGRGLGASHQTGWTGLIAKLLMPRRPPSLVPETEHASLLRERAAAEIVHPK